MYLKYIKMNIRSFLQYRSALVMVLFAQGIGFLVTLFGIWLLFDRFGNIKGYTLAEVAVCYACVHFAFSSVELFAQGFDVFPQLISSGDFDRVLLRPRGTVIQVLGSNFDLVKISKIILAVILYAVSLPRLETIWSIWKIITLILMNLSGIMVFFGIYIASAAVSFKTVEGLEFLNVLTYGGQQLTSYPLSIYSKAIRVICMIIPFGAFNYLPLLYVTGRNDNPLYALTPLLGFVFILPCLLIWRIGVRHYLSTGN